MAQDFEYKHIKDAGKYSKLGDEAIQRAKNDIGIAEATKQDIESINKVIEPIGREIEKIDKEIETKNKEIETKNKEIETINKEIEAIDNNKKLSDAEKKQQKDAKEKEKDAKEKEKDAKEKEKDAKEKERESRQKEKDAKEKEKEKIGAVLFEDGSVRLENGDRVYSSTNVRLDDGTQVNPEEKDVKFTNGITYDKKRTITIPPEKDSNGNITKKQVKIGRYDYIQEVGGGTYAWEKQWDDKLQPASVRNAFKKDLETKYSDMKDAFSCYKKDMNGDDPQKLKGSAANLVSRYNLLSSQLKKLDITDKQAKNVIEAWMSADFEKILKQAKHQDVYRGENSDSQQREDASQRAGDWSDKKQKEIEENRNINPAFKMLLKDATVFISRVSTIPTDARLLLPRGARDRAVDLKKRKDKERRGNAEGNIEYAEGGARDLQKYTDDLVEGLEQEINDPKNAALRNHFDKFIENNKHLDDIDDFKDANKRRIVKQELEKKYRHNNGLSPDDQKILDYINALELQNIATNLTKTLEESRATLEDITALSKSDPNRRKQYNQYNKEARKIVKSMMKSGLFEEIGKDGKNKLGITQQAQSVLILNGKGQSKTIEQAKNALPHEYEQDAGL